MPRMNLTDELEKLAALHRNGQLTDGEFASAKSRLLGTDEAAPAPEVLDAPPPDTLPEKKVYRSSRWSSGNLFFPDRLTLAADGLHFRKGALFGSHEEHIAYRAIASLRVENGIFLSDLTIETSGGSQPIHINGLWKSAARKVQAAVQAVQSADRRYGT
jgi:hypothetical protein